MEKQIYQGPILPTYNPERLHEMIINLGGDPVLTDESLDYVAKAYHLWETTVLVCIKDKTLEVKLFYDKYNDESDVEKLLKPLREKLVDEEDSYIVL